MAEDHSPRKPKKEKARTEAATMSGEGHDNASTSERAHRTELAVSSIVIKSDFADEGADKQAELILNRFNEGVEKSAFTLNPALGRALSRCDITMFALGHRNQIAELMDPRGARYATVYTADPTQTIKTLGTVSKTAHYFGAFGKHVLNVPAGHYALAFSKNRPVIYGEGPHIIIDPTFQFNEVSGFVNQQEPYIHHQTVHILRVPAGRIAKVWIGTLPFIYESRRDPYVIVDAQFKLVSPDGSKKVGLFYSAGETYIEHGSIKRIIPHTGEVAITYNNGILTVIQTPKDGKPVVIDSPTHHFDGFISTSLQTCLFPSKETKQQAMLDNSAATSDEVNLKIFQTRDSLRVGVVLVVAFKIVDPECAITKLGKEGIISHIENVSFADMGKAIQLSTLQEVMYFTQSRPPKAGTAPTDAEEALQTIQDRVRNHLARDLADYGIELARLQIETMKVLDTEIAKKLAGQSVTSAEFTTKQATLVKEYDIKTTEARLKAETDNIALAQANQARISEAQARLQAAQREAEALIIAAEAQRKASELQAELYILYPELLEIELLKIKSHALRSATVYVTPKGDAASVMNSPLLYLPRVQQPGRSPAAAEVSKPKFSK
jgi:regulator of protease activity HflC (stomatin/prohibitin superfamily)